MWFTKLHFIKSERLKIFMVLTIISAVLASQNPLSDHSFITGLPIILLMISVTAIPLHIYAKKKNLKRLRNYRFAGALCGGSASVLYCAIYYLASGTYSLSLIVLLTMSGGVIGALCGLVFWRVVVSKIDIHQYV